MIINDKRVSAVIPKLSVIVPVYNTASFVKRTLSSFNKEGSPEIEVIIVNDGSTDHSIEVVEEWLEKYNGDALFITQENKGLSEARNTGLKYARGEYISFCDSDDWVNENTLLDSIEFAKSENLDIILYRSYVYDNQNKQSYPFYDAHVWDNILNGERQRTVNIYSHPQLLSLEPNTNNRLIKRSFFDKYIEQFPIGIHFEDVFPHVISFINADKIGMLDSIGYFYRVNRDGKITEQKSEKRFDIIKTAAELMSHRDLLVLNDLQHYYINSLLLKMIFWCGRNTVLSDRQRFYKEATSLFSTKNMMQRARLKRSLSFASRNREFILMLAFYNQAYIFLAEYSTDKKTIQTKTKLARSLISLDPKICNIVFKKGMKFVNSKTFKKN